MNERKTKVKLGDIADLLEIIEKTGGYPRLKAIHDQAMGELEEIAQGIENANKPEEQEPPPSYGVGEIPTEEDRRA